MSTKLWQRVFLGLVLAGMLVTFWHPGGALGIPGSTRLLKPASKLADAAGAVEVVYPLKADVSPRCVISRRKQYSECNARDSGLQPPEGRTSNPNKKQLLLTSHMPNMPSPLVNFEGVNNCNGVYPRHSGRCWPESLCSMGQSEFCHLG